MRHFREIEDCGRVNNIVIWTYIVRSFNLTKKLPQFVRKHKLISVTHACVGGMLEKMQMVPGLNDTVWQALPFYGSRVPSSDAIRPCLAAVTSMKQEVMSCEVVRRALYSAALDLMSSGAHVQPRLIVPAHPHHLRHHHHHQQQQQQQQVQGGAVLFSDMMRRESVNQLHDGTPSCYHLSSCSVRHCGV